MSLKVQLEHLEQKISVLTERINQGDEWKRHLECWLLNHLGMNFPAHLSLTASKKEDGTHNDTGENNNDAFKENEENQFSNLIKFRTKRSYGASDTKKPEVKVYQKKKRNSAANNDKSTASGGVGTSSSSSSASGSSSSIVMKSASDPQNSATTTELTTTTSYIITPTEIVQSPANEIEIDNVKYEPAETEESQEPINAVEMNVNAVNVGEAVMGDDQAPIQEEARYRIQEENNVLHIIKIEADPMSADGEHAVINYSDALPIVQLANVQHDNNSQLSSNLAVFSGPLGEETAIGFLNPDGSVTPCRPNVIISAGSGLTTAGTIQQFNVVQAAPSPVSLATATIPASVPATVSVSVPVAATTVTVSAPQTPPKPAENPIDPKGTFVCNICENTFQGLYLFRQHEKKSECRRIAKKLKKSEPSSAPSTTYLKTAESSYLAPTGPNLSSPVLNTPILKYKCSICGSCYASEAYLRFHLSKVHNRTPD